MSQQNKNKQAPEIRRSVKKMSIICMCAISVVLAAQRKGDRTPPLQQPLRDTVALPSAKNTRQLLCRV